MTLSRDEKLAVFWVVVAIAVVVGELYLAVKIG